MAYIPIDTDRFTDWDFLCLNSSSNRLELKNFPFFNNSLCKHFYRFQHNS